MFVTTIPLFFASNTSITLYPVASTPIYLHLGRLSNSLDVKTTLFVNIISASFALSIIWLLEVRSYTFKSQILLRISQVRSPAVRVAPSKTTAFID